MKFASVTKCALFSVVALIVAQATAAQNYKVLYSLQGNPTASAQPQSIPAAGNMPDGGKTVVAWIDIETAIFASKEGKRKMAAIRKVPQEKQQEVQGEIGNGILMNMAPVIDRFAVDNGLGIIVDTGTFGVRDAIFWTKQYGGNILRRQVDITKQIIDTFDGASVHLKPIAGDQRVEVINVEKAVFSTDDGKRELAAIGNNVTPEQKQKVLERILAKMTPVVAKVADDGGADIVIDIAQKWPQASCLWFAQRLDITDQVVSAYNKR